MLFFLISILAGILTILAPCILPLLPIIIGSSNAETSRKISKKSIKIILSLSLSVIIFTLLLKTSTLLIDIPNYFWAWFSGAVLIVLGLVMLYPELWSKNSLILKIKLLGDKKLAGGHKKDNSIGDYIVGLSLGPVFSTCSPTYLFIIATVLPASFIVGFTYLLGFVLGLLISLLLVAYFGQSIVSKIIDNSDKAEMTKRVFGFLILLVGIAIFTGIDKKIETLILDSGYGATIYFEQILIDNFGEEIDELNSTEAEVKNLFLQSAFPDTNWSQTDPVIERAVPGGPGKDGIPAIDNPKFESINEFDRSDDIQAIVLKNGGLVKVYPYNILTWHEIVNDEIVGKEVSVTFCPLCGSALVFNRDLENGETTFGVSGALLESNMIMYDRDTESLWQQSTGEALVGDYFGTQLEHVPFQLLTMGELKRKYPSALVLSEETGYVRDYGRNPYSGYMNTESLIFDTSSKDLTFEMKEIMVAFRLQGKSFAMPMNQIKDNQSYIKNTEFGDIEISKSEGEISIKKENGDQIPFYFEMWFSWFVQNGEEGEVINL